MASGLNGNTGRVVLGVVLAGLLGEGSYTIHQLGRYGERLARVEANQAFIIDHLTAHEGENYGFGSDLGTSKASYTRTRGDIEADPDHQQQVYSVHPDSLCDGEELLAPGPTANGNYSIAGKW